MAVYKCSVCDTEYDEEKEGISWQDLPEDWVCPVCDSSKSMFQRVGDAVSEPQATVEIDQPAVKTISDLMVDTMVNWGVTSVFGMVGHSNLGLSDAIRRQCEADNLNYIGIRHEGAASFAASAYAKLNGHPAACLAIAGPGATNLLTGLWDAKLDRVPILALS